MKEAKLHDVGLLRFIHLSYFYYLFISIDTDVTMQCHLLDIPPSAMVNT